MHFLYLMKMLSFWLFSPAIFFARLNPSDLRRSSRRDINLDALKWCAKISSAQASLAFCSIVFSGISIWVMTSTRSILHFSNHLDIINFRSLDHLLLAYFLAKIYLLTSLYHSGGKSVKKSHLCNLVLFGRKICQKTGTMYIILEIVPFW